MAPFRLPRRSAVISSMPSSDALLWECNGVTGVGESPPPVANTKRGRRLLIAGAGHCLWDDVAKVPARAIYDVMCINQAGLYWPDRFDHWAIWDSPLNVVLPGLRPYCRPIPKGRAQHMPRFDGIVHTQQACDWSPHIAWRFEPSGGSTTLLACKAAVVLGYREILLAGCPMDGRGHFYDPPPEPLTELDNYWDMNAYGWGLALPALKAAGVRSLSGVTRDLLGGPDVS